MTRKFNEHSTGAGAQKIRLLCVVTQSEMGGAQQFLAQLLWHLDRSLFEILTIAGQDGKNELSEILPPNVPYTVLPALRRNPTFLFLNDWRSVFQLRRAIMQMQPNIVLLMSSKAGFIGALATFLVRLKMRPVVIYRIGGWTFSDPIPRIMRWFYIALEWLSAHWKDYIVVNSIKDANDAKRLGIKPRMELLVIHNGIDPYMPLPGRDTARQNLMRAAGNSSLFNGKFVIGTVANFYPAKGLEHLIRAAAQCQPEMAFIVIGDGVLRPQLEQLTRELNLEKRVYLVGKIPHAAQYLPAFDAFVLPSLKEGFPWAVLEAMAAKIPIIATRVGAIPDIIEHEKSGFIVEPRSPKAIAQALTRLSHDSRMRQELPIQAHQTLLKQFDVCQMVNRFEQLFVTAVQRSPR